MFGHVLRIELEKHFGDNADVWLLKKLGKKIVYSSNGCSDGVSQTSFSNWGGDPVCDICIWKDRPLTCSDTRNLTWGLIRNKLADYIIISGGNRADYNMSEHVHEVPEFYCADPSFLSPDITIPDKYTLNYPNNAVKIYHSVGDYASRTNKATEKNIKCTHITLPVINRLKSEGYPVELVFCTNVPNKDVRYYQLQSDIVVDMLTYGWFGSNIIESMMLGVTCVCYIRETWLDIIKKELPDYVNELPVVNATPETIYDVLKDLIEHPEKREEIGKRSREFAIKWHSSESGAKRLDQIYSELLKKGV
jgi:glycosyltransferase involved in cell wall biosynthesis